MGRTTEAVAGHYRQIWNKLPREEQRRRVALAARSGLIIEDGVAVCPCYHVRDAKGRRVARIRPLHFRLRALAGDKEAIDYCESRGWLWRVPEREWSELEHSYILDAQSQPVPASPSLAIGGDGTPMRRRGRPGRIGPEDGIRPELVRAPYKEE